MRKWAVKLSCALQGKTKEQNLKKKPIKEIVKSALLELQNCAEKILGEEVSFLIFRTVQTR